MSILTILIYKSDYLFNENIKHFGCDIIYDKIEPVLRC